MSVTIKYHVGVCRASFVGVVYGLAAISTTDLAVPMIAHSVANLVAAYVWRIEEDDNLKSK